MLAESRGEAGFHLYPSTFPRLSPRSIRGGSFLALLGKSDGTPLAEIAVHMALPPPIPVVVFFSQFLPGGTEGQMSELARRLDRRRFEVHVACLHRNGSWMHRATEGAASVADFPIRGFARLSTIGKMRSFAAWCRERRIAVLHATDLYANVFALPAALAAGVSVRIANRREINPDKSAGLMALQRLAYTCAHTIVANSSAARARLRQEGVSDRTITIIPNGIDLSAYHVSPRQGRLRRILTVANLRAEKAHETLIDAAALLLADYPDAEFRFAGGGSRLEDLRRYAARRGVAARVHFLGHRDDVPALLADSDVFALTSRSEAFPNSVIEAMAAGLPLVVTNVGGVAELIDHRRNGVLVPPDDPRAVAAALRELMTNPQQAAALGEAARQTVEARFSFDRMVRSFEELYLDLLHRHAPHTVPATQLIPS
jgi:glycosyltransferase involved in cell wall biosynthesis